jgi:glycosyltransferase involved in cell wall biosynthesis
MTTTAPRVALDARMIAHSGIGTHLRGLLEGLRQLPDAPWPLLLGPPELLRAEPAAEGCEMLAWDAPIYSIREQASFPARELKRRGVRVIHSPHYNMPLRAAGLKRLVTVHDLIHLVFQDNLSLPARLYARTMLRQVARRADRLFAVSEHTRADMQKLLGVEPARVEIVYNAPAAVFAERPAPERVAEVRQRLGLPERYVLGIGIDKPHKNFGFLVEVFAKLFARDSQTPALVLAGIPSERAEFYREKARSAGGARPEEWLMLPGKVAWEDVPPLYAGATLLALPTLYEGFCLPAVEAQSLGVPLAASSASCLPEVAGDGAAYFSPRDHNDAARVIGELLANEPRRRDLAARGQENARRFSWKRSAEIVARAWEEESRAV